MVCRHSLLYPLLRKNGRGKHYKHTTVSERIRRPATLSLTRSRRNVSTHALSKKRSVPPKICRFAMKGLPRGQVQQARRAYFMLKTSVIFSATLCFRNRRSGKSLRQSRLKNLSHSRSNGGKPMVQCRQSCLAKHTHLVGTSSFLWSSDGDEVFLAHRGNVHQPVPRRETT